MDIDTGGQDIGSFSGGAGWDGEARRDDSDCYSDLWRWIVVDCDCSCFEQGVKS